MKKLFILIFIAFVAFSCSSQGPKPNEIWYTSNDGNTIQPGWDGGFGANIISNIYKDGKGVITFDKELTSIGFGAFLSCSSLTSITIPDSVTFIGDSAFENCTSLTSITIPNNVTSIKQDAFKNCTSLTSIIIPDSSIHTYIGVNAFRNCVSLTDITIGNRNTSIGLYAFKDCTSLTSVTIPNNVSLLASGAFSGCTSLKEIYCERVTPPEGGINMFYGNALERKIYVPIGSGEVYKTTQYWSEWCDYIEEKEF